MYKKIAISLFLKNNLIQYDEIDEFTYGLEVLCLKIMHILVFLILGYSYGKLISMLIFLSTYSFIRSRIGGFHAKKSINCLIISFLIGICLWYCLCINHLNVKVIIITHCLLSIIICFLYPKLLPIIVILLLTFVFPYYVYIPIWFAELVSVLLWFVNKVKNYNNYKLK